MQEIIVIKDHQFRPLRFESHLPCSEGRHLLVLDATHADSWWVVDWAQQDQRLYVCSWNDAFSLEVVFSNLRWVFVLCTPVIP